MLCFKVSLDLKITALIKVFILFHNVGVALGLSSLLCIYFVTVGALYRRYLDTVRKCAGRLVASH